MIGKCLDDVFRPRVEYDQCMTEEKARHLSLIFEGIVAVAALVALPFGIVQLIAINNGLDSSAAGAIYSQQQVIDAIFVEHPDLEPYFGRNIPLPVVDSGSSDKAKQEAVEDEAAQANAVAYQILDHFEHVRYQIGEDVFEEDDSGWEDYFESSFEKSQVLCAALVNEFDSYDADDEGSLWSEDAKGPCTKLGIMPPAE